MNIPDPSGRVSRPADAAALWAAALFPSFATWLYFVVLTQNPSAAVQAAYAAEKVLQFAFPLVWVVLVQRQKLRLARPNRAGMTEGLVFGAAVLAGMLLLYFQWLKPAGYLAAAAVPITAKATALGMGSPARFILGGVLLSSIHSLLEEYYWRWFLFGGLRRFMPVAPAVILSSLAFTAHHVILLAIYFGGSPLATIFFSLCVTVGGAAWAWIYHRSGSLLGPWLSHLLIDAGIFIVGYDLMWPCP
ncbi:MAG: CPBP family intramembrane glutamic endopeptidase [Planctomycetota bacterium]